VLARVLNAKETEANTKESELLAAIHAL